MTIDIYRNIVAIGSWCSFGISLQYRYFWKARIITDIYKGIPAIKARLRLVGDITNFG